MSTKNPKHEISFYGKMLSFSRIHLTTNDFDLITSALEKVSPEKNSDIPIVIDADVELDLKKLVDLLWNWGLQPIGVVKGKLDKQAKELRLAIFPSEGKRIQRVTVKPMVNNSKEQAKQEIYKNNKEKEKEKVSLTDNELEIDFDEIDKLEKNKNKPSNEVEVKVEEEALENVASLVYDHLLRSGQSINHVGGETGDQNAHIFCQKFNPSLVSVAGTYMLRDTIPADVIDKPVQVSYKEGKGLVFRIMDEWLNNTTNNAFNTIHTKK